MPLKLPGAGPGGPLKREPLAKPGLLGDGERVRFGLMTGLDAGGMRRSGEPMA